MKNERLQINDISMVGTELSEEDLRLAAGGMWVVDIKSYENGRYVDHEILIFE